jgi:hypothetical protein
MELHQSVIEFFHQVVTQALKSQQVDATDHTEFYLVHLLSGFTKTAKIDEEPLVLKLAQATTFAPEERVRALREVGDTTLYVSGFFADSLARKLVDVDYYMQMGGAAYGQASRLVAQSRAGHADSRGEVWAELAGKFPQYVEVLHEIRANTHIASSTNLLRLYEEWLKTGSEWMEKRLKATGLMARESFADKKVVH